MLHQDGGLILLLVQGVAVAKVKLSVVVQANSTAELPGNRPYWKTNGEGCYPGITPEGQYSWRFRGLFRNYSLTDQLYGWTAC